MNIIFQIDGGLGKCIMSTAICKIIKENNPDSELIVVSGYPDVYLNNPSVDKAFAFGEEKYFYERYIEDKECIIYAHNPYLEVAHAQHREHLLETWAKMFGYTWNGELPELYLTSREQEFFSNRFTSDKPLLTLQTNGGAENQELKYSWARDLPHHVAQEIVDKYKNEYNVVHIRRDDQPELKDTIHVSDSFRAICVLLMMSKKRLLIDSFAQHASAALGLPSVVCWIANKPSVFGYDLHSNIQSNPFTKKPELKNAYIGKFNIIGDPLEFPYNNEAEIFDVQNILIELDSI
jgi:hypothetical protein